MKLVKVKNTGGKCSVPSEHCPPVKFGQNETKEVPEALAKDLVTRPHFELVTSGVSKPTKTKPAASAQGKE